MSITTNLCRNHIIIIINHHHHHRIIIIIIIFLWILLYLYMHIDDSLPTINLKSFIVHQNAHTHIHIHKIWFIPKSYACACVCLGLFVFQFSGISIYRKSLRFFCHAMLVQFHSVDAVTACTSPFHCLHMRYSYI